MRSFVPVQLAPEVKAKLQKRIEEMFGEGSWYCVSRHPYEDVYFINVFKLKPEGVVGQKGSTKYFGTYCVKEGNVIQSSKVGEMPEQPEGFKEEVLDALALR